MNAGKNVDFFLFKIVFIAMEMLRAEKKRVVFGREAANHSKLTKKYL